MSTIEEVIAEWKNDSVVDETKINQELMRSPQLHAKYLEHYIFFKAKLASFEKKRNVLSYQKRRYFRGEMTKDELLAHGWPQWQNLKPSSTELNQLLDMDSDMNELTEKVSYYKTGVSTIEWIMKSIQGRDYSIKTIFEYLKYASGG